MAYNFKNEEEVKEYMDKIGIEYRFSCFKEKNAEGCHLLGDWLEAIAKEFQPAAKVYQDNCDERKFSRSCLKYGNYCYLGKGIKQDLLESYNYYRKACDLDLAEGCLYTGVMLTKEKNMEHNFEQGIKDLEKACSLGNTKACYFASGIYISGEGSIPQNKTKASELSLRACDGGNIYACMNLSHMYRLGDGVEKDEKKSMEFKERAKEIKSDLTKKRGIGLQQYA